METIIIMLIIFGFLFSLCFGFGYIITYDDRHKYKLKKLEAVKRDEIDELKSQIISLKQTVENNRRTLDYIQQFVYDQEMKKIEQEVIDSNVYGAYSPKEYERRGKGGGIGSEGNMEVTVTPTGTLWLSYAAAAR